MVLLRQLLSPTLARTMPDAVVLLFAVSQLSAIVDFRAVAHELQARPIAHQLAVFVAVLLLATPGVWRTVRKLRDDPQVRWVWALPIRTGPVFAGVGAIRGAPLASLALLLGPLAFLLALVLLAGLGLLLGQRRFRRTVRPGSQGGWWGRTPLTARLNRDLLALRRHGGLQVALPILVPTLMHAALARQWDASGVASGGLIGLTLIGWLPTWTATRLSNALGPAWQPRHSPLAPAKAVLALWIATGAPLLAVVLLQTAFSPAGLLRRLVLAGFFIAFGAWTVVRREPSQRRHAQGDGIAVAIFAGLFAWAWPPAWIPLLLGSGLLFLLTTRSSR